VAPATFRVRSYEREGVAVLRLKGMVLTCGAVASVLAGAAPASAGRQPRHVDAQAAAAAEAPRGLVFGGITASNWPVVVALNERGSRVDQVVIGLDLTCTSGDSFGTSDGYQRLKISRKGRFTTTFGPQRIDTGGVPADIESKVIGRFNKGRGSMRGIWSLKITLYDAAAANVVDTCESGLVKWTAVQ
jgi:hypothetical protein